MSGHCVKPIVEDGSSDGGEGGEGQAAGRGGVSKTVAHMPLTSNTLSSSITSLQFNLQICQHHFKANEINGCCTIVTNSNTDFRRMCVCVCVCARVSLNNNAVFLLFPFRFSVCHLSIVTHNCLCQDITFLMFSGFVVQTTVLSVISTLFVNLRSCHRRFNNHLIGLNKTHSFLCSLCHFFYTNTFT